MSDELMYSSLFYKITPINTKLGYDAARRRQLLIDYFPKESERLTLVLDGTDFYTAPASTKYHGSYPGGLFDHCMNVSRVLQYLTNMGVCNKWDDKRSPVIVGMLHDFTKVGQYKRDFNTGKFVWNNDAITYGGHGSDSVIKLLQKIPLTPEEIACIRYHMGAYEKETWEDLDKAIKLYPNVLWTHTADMYALKILEWEVSCIDY